MTSKEIFQAIGEKKNQDLDSQRMVERKLQIYFDNLGEIEILEKSIDTLKDFSEDYKIAVVSNSEGKLVDHVVSFLDLEKYLDAVMSFDDVEEGKPNPKVFTKASERMNVKPENSVVIEDSEVGVEGAKREGFLTVRFNPDQTGKSSKADHTVTSMKEFRELVKERS